MQQDDLMDGNLIMQCRHSANTAQNPCVYTDSQPSMIACID